YWYRQAADQGHRGAQYYLALCYFQGVGAAKDPQESIRWLRRAAGQGHADAQALLEKLLAALPATGGGEVL
ncbi:MAG: sel1 repeat family protein, partial [Rubrivivax sp.]